MVKSEMAESEVEVIHSWTAPRSLSTSLMYSFAQRDDIEVLDEPLYAYFLKVTGLDRPYREELLSKMVYLSQNALLHYLSSNRLFLISGSKYDFTDEEVIMSIAAENNFPSTLQSIFGCIYDLLYVFSNLSRNLNFIEHTHILLVRNCKYQRLRSIIIDPTLYLSKKSDLALTTQGRTLPTSFKLFSGICSRVTILFDGKVCSLVAASLWFEWLHFVAFVTRWWVVVAHVCASGGGSWRLASRRRRAGGLQSVASSNIWLLRLVDSLVLSDEFNHGNCRWSGLLSNYTFWMSERLIVGVVAQQITGISGFCSHSTIWVVDCVLSARFEVEVGLFGLDGEVDRLKRDRQVLMAELVKLRQQQQNTRVHIQAMEGRLKRTEQKQQQTMNFLARAMQNPNFVQQLVQQKKLRKEVMEAFSKKRRSLDQGSSNVVEVGELH
ncbi:hypothetical protein V8G54_000367 [Vigna mungo]|uniref:Uncharacterized protein n=1 Tax=Vigna mungo TaxID=3915 RepID=A0AAQ3P5C1_VIGMU